MVAIGWGERVYLVNPGTRQTVTIRLGSYFARTYPAENHLLIASAERLFLISSDGIVRWQTGRLGIDGVVVDCVDSGVVRGRGEWDPPGGWRAFSVNLQDGRPVR